MGTNGVGLTSPPLVQEQLSINGCWRSIFQGQSPHHLVVHAQVVNMVKSRCSSLMTLLRLEARETPCLVDTMPLVYLVNLVSWSERPHETTCSATSIHTQCDFLLLKSEIDSWKGMNFTELGLKLHSPKNLYQVFSCHDKISNLAEPRQAKLRKY